MIYNKLVRDKIPKIIETHGEIAITHIADETEFESALFTKLQEEVLEFTEAKSPEELADIFEVINSIVKLKSISLDEVEKIRIEKFQKRGGFDNRIILEETKKLE